MVHTEELADFRGRARAWLEQHRPAQPRPAAGDAMAAWDRAWQQQQWQGGWAGTSWPTEYGGMGADKAYRLVWVEECLRLGLPRESVFDVAQYHVGPTILSAGTAAQRSRFIPPILRGETVWCQCFSEPEAGSDLAALRTRGVVDGDSIRVSGTKIWSTFAHHADLAEVLVRTSTGERPSQGLTWLAVDLRAPGVHVEPIPTIDRKDSYCEVRFDDVRVPLANVLGAVGDGWRIAMVTLTLERGPSWLEQRLAPLRDVALLAEMIATRGLADDPAVRHQLHQTEILARGLRSLAIREAVAPESGPEGSATLVVSGQVEAAVGRLAMTVLGSDGVELGDWQAQWLTSFSKSIGGGTTDIQRNVIGERVLGLPR